MLALSRASGRKESPWNFMNEANNSFNILTKEEGDYSKKNTRKQSLLSKITVSSCLRREKQRFSCLHLESHLQHLFCIAITMAAHT